eukprot:GFYU01035247.1.p1 GENE.GFYU01035247.1~~GFYU01035247.1.p1  ORF type:complete len:540 (-),score=146.44 GFYU01035247.1:62-1645(-)
MDRLRAISFARGRSESAAEYGVYDDDSAASDSSTGSGGQLSVPTMKERSQSRMDDLFNFISNLGGVRRSGSPADDKATEKELEAITEEDGVSDAKDSYGFPLTSDQVPLHEDFTKKYAKQTDKQRDRWVNHLKKYTPATLPRDKALLNLVRQGIPHELRSEMWQHLSGAHAMMLEHEGYYEELASASKGDHAKFKEIEKDLDRTFPGHELFQLAENIDRLRRVLRAYMLRNPEIGYCQSMNYLAASLLLFMEEEEAFWTLVVIVEEILVDYFSESMMGSYIDQSVFKELIGEKLPKLASHLEAIGMPLPLISHQWFLCLYVNALPWETTFRVWDSLFYEGRDVLFRVGIAILKQIESTLLQHQESGPLMRAIQDITVNLYDCDGLLKAAYKSGSYENAEGYREQFTKQYQAWWEKQQQEKELENAVEEANELEERCESLEEENTQLRDALEHVTQEWEKEKSKNRRLEEQLEALQGQVRQESVAVEAYEDIFHAVNKSLKVTSESKESEFVNPLFGENEIVRKVSLK